MNAHHNVHPTKTTLALKVSIWMVHFLATVAFVVTGPVKLITNPSLIWELDISQWLFYLSGGIGSLKVLHDMNKAFVFVFANSHATCHSFVKNR